MNNGKYKFEVNVILHGLLGVFLTISPVLVNIWFVIVFFYLGIWKVIQTKNRGGQAHLIAAYLCGMEMIIRMSRSGLPHEVAKYSVLVLLLTGVLVRPVRALKPVSIVVYGLFLLPSVFLVESNVPDRVRQLISANLSGPFCLVVAVIYFYNRYFTKKELSKVFQYLLLPIVSTLGYLFIITPNISEIDFSTGANVAASGFGPNQMSSMLGLGILIIGISYLFRLQIIKSNIISVLLLLLLSYRGLLTFSRGGMIGPVFLVAVLFIYFSFFYKSYRKILLSRLFIFGFFFVGLSFVFDYVNEQTGEALYQRYTEVKTEGTEEEKLDKFTSGRTLIMRLDFEIFKDHFLLGIGPGMGGEKRAEYGYPLRVAAHIEFTRMLAEHGIFGLIALIILLVLPVVRFVRSKSLEEKAIITATVGFCFIFMAHSATRIAAPMFLYGFSFLRIYSAKDLLKINYYLKKIRTKLQVREGVEASAVNVVFTN